MSPLICKKILNFLISGSIGYLLDVSFYYTFYNIFDLNSYLSRASAFIPATLVTWLFNRNQTFKVRQKNGYQIFLEYSNYLKIQSFGMLINYSTFSIIEATLNPNQKLLSLAIGSIAAMAFNFIKLDRYYRNDNDDF